MHSVKKMYLACAVGIMSVAAPLATYAQTSNSQSGQTSTGSMGGRSWLPYTSYGYIGASVGKSDYRIGGCSGILSCDDTDTGFKLYTGGKMSQHFGLELGYFNLGDAARNGGDVSAQGANLTVLGNIPVADNFNLYGKLGGIYGWTETNAAIPGVAAGKEDGFGLNYGAGMQFDVSKTVAIRADWDRYRLKFVNQRENADLYSVGLVFKY